MSNTLRYRGEKKNLIELAKNLDAFKQIPEEYKETTEIGGTLSLLSRLFIVFLIYKEWQYYQNANLAYHFSPDIYMDEQVQMHVDITVAMPCASLSGVDLMDETQQDVFAYGTLQREDTMWTLSPEQRSHFERMAHMNTYLREEYHSVADILFKEIIQYEDHVEITPLAAAIAAVEGVKYDACRLHGSLGLNKVAGVLHLVGGAQPVVGLFEDHFMIEFRRMPANFTHRINRLSFGQYSRRIVQPLEGDERIITDEDTTVQYFLNIVPTEIHKTFSTINTFQYSVTENVRKLDPDHNSFGSPGIYFKYDWSALKIVVRTDRDHIVQFCIRLCSIIAGIIVISGILNVMLLSLQRMLIKKFAPQLAYSKLPTTIPKSEKKNKQNTNGLQATNNAYVSLLPPTVQASNDLLTAANQMTSNNLNSTNFPATFYVPSS